MSDEVCFWSFLGLMMLIAFSTIVIWNVYG